MVEGWSTCPKGTGLVQPRENGASGAPNSSLPIFLKRLLRRWSFIAVHGGSMRTYIETREVQIEQKGKKLTVRIIQYWGRLPR